MKIITFPILALEAKKCYTPAMDLRTIENTIAGLPREMLANFDKWYANFIADKWDQQIIEDAKNGKLDAMSAGAVKDFYDGKYEEI